MDAATLAEATEKLSRLLSPQRTVLENGLTVVTKQDKTSGFAHIVLGTRRGGSFFGPPELFHLLEHILSVPYRNRASGADPDAETAVSRMTIAEVSVKERKFDKKLGAIVQDLRHPAFDALERERGAVLVELGEHHDDPEAFLANQFYAACFPKSNLGRFLHEDFESVRHHLTKAILVRYWRKFFVPSNLILSVVGEKLSHEKICEVARELFPASDAPQPRFKRPELGRSETTLDAPCVVVRPGLKNAYFALGKALPRFTLKDRAVLRAVGELLADRLNHALRYRMGLVYGIEFNFSNTYLFNHWYIAGSCEAKHFPRVIEAVRRELGRFTVSERALTKKRELIFEGYERIASDPEGCAYLLYDLEVDGVNLVQYLAEFTRITLKRARAVAARCFSPASTVLVIVRSKP
ncbi:MAG: pitrilysin family protein [bacterium]|nr:pitrilysin family protein [bacterium]